MMPKRRLFQSGVEKKVSVCTDLKKPLVYLVTQRLLLKNPWTRWRRTRILESHPFETKPRSVWFGTRKGLKCLSV